jgi:transposase
MGSGKRLTEYEKGQIDVRRDNGQGYKKIAKALNRSSSAVAKYLNGKTGQTKSTGRPKKLSERQERQIIKKASNSFKSLSKIKNELKLNVGKTTVWNTIKKSNVIVRRKLMKAPALTDDHKIRRLKFAKENMATDWSKVNHLNFNFKNLSIFRSFGVTKRSLIWMVRMDATLIGTTCVRNDW